MIKTSSQLRSKCAGWRDGKLFRLRRSRVNRRTDGSGLRDACALGGAVVGAGVVFDIQPVGFLDQTLAERVGGLAHPLTGRFWRQLANAFLDAPRDVDAVLRVAFLVRHQISGVILERGRDRGEPARAR